MREDLQPTCVVSNPRRACGIAQRNCAQNPDAMAVAVRRRELQQRFDGSVGYRGNWNVAILDRDELDAGNIELNPQELPPFVIKSAGYAAYGDLVIKQHLQLFKCRGYVGFIRMRTPGQ